MEFAYSEKKQTNMLIYVDCCGPYHALLEISPSEYYSHSIDYYPLPLSAYSGFGCSYLPELLSLLRSLLLQIHSNDKHEATAKSARLIDF